MDTKKWFEKIYGKTNDSKIEREFRENCLLYERQCSNQPLNQDYQQYLSYYHQITSLYHIYEEDNITKLVIYDTENQTEEVIILNLPEPLDYCTFVTQLPNSELICHGKHLTFIIDRNNNIKALPSKIPCSWSSSIYFSNNLYCFGGSSNGWNPWALSRKFDFHDNRWINLTKMPKADHSCHSVIFNGNILISGYFNINILIYSIDIDSFSIIPYEFLTNCRKILIKVEKLYLIEIGEEDLIYESEDEYNWIQISTSLINYGCNQVYWAYNKGEIYISTGPNYYYKFDLKEKLMNYLWC